MRERVLRAIRAYLHGRHTQGLDRKQLLVAIWARVERVRESGNPAVVLEAGADAELHELMKLAPDPAKDLEVAEAIGWLYWERFRYLQEGSERTTALIAAGACLTLAYRATPEKIPEVLRRSDPIALLSDEPNLWISQAVQSFKHFEEDGDITALRESVRLFRRSLAAISEDNPRYGPACHILCRALRLLFEHNSDTSVLLESVKWGRQAVASTPDDHPHRAERLVNLGNSHLAVFKHTGDVTALHKAAQLGRQAVAVAPDDHPYRASILINLGEMLRQTYQHSGDTAALLEAAQLGRHAVAAGPDEGDGGADLFAFLTRLQVDLQLAFEQRGGPDLVVEAVSIGREALAAIPDDHPERHVGLNDLSIGLGMLYNRNGDMDTLFEAVQIGRDAVATTPDNHPNRPMYQSTLAGTLIAWFQQREDEEALWEAVRIGRQAVAATLDDYPERHIRLNNLSLALRFLYWRNGDMDTLLEAVQASRDALAAVPDKHPDRSRILLNLAAALEHLSDHAQRAATFRDALATVPDDHPDRATLALNFAAAWERPAENAQNASALSEAVQISRDAVAAASSNGPDRAMCLNSLCIVLRNFFEQSRDPEALREAVRAGRDAVAALPGDHPERARNLLNLGLALRSLSERTDAADALIEARHAYTEAADLVAAPVRLRVTAHWSVGRIDMETGDAASALGSYEQAISFLLRVAPRAMSHRDRQQTLGEMSGLPGEAASVAIAADRPTRALELLEQARGMLLAEAMDARHDLADLRHRAPELAERFERLRSEVDAAGHDGEGGQSLWQESIREFAEQRHRMAAEWDTLLVQIRATSGMEDFLLPPLISRLRRQAEEGPVVVLNASRFRCDALLLTSDADRPVRAVPLSRVVPLDLVLREGRFLNAAAALTDPDCPPTDQQLAQQEMSDLLAWIWDEITAPVLKELGLAQRPKAGQGWKRVWWCPIGSLAFLPLHAAGHHDGPGSDAAEAVGEARTARTVLDCVVSSYTPTVRALGYARSSGSSPPGGARGGALIVAMPNTPGASALPGAGTEADKVAELLPGSNLLTGPNATRDTVLAALPGHRIAHLACHGLSDWNAPAASRLLLHDHADNPLTIGAVSRLRLTDAELAYISACSTSRTHPSLTDEAVHITAAFQIAGYRQVIGTLWPIDDTTAVGISAAVYSFLTDEGKCAPDTARAAHALHHATRRLRDSYPANPALWAAHIHVGR